MAEATKKQVMMMGGLYVFFSSTMMIFNKAALRVFPFPMQLTAIQYFISAAAVVVLAMAKVVTAEGLQMAKVKQFWLVSACFSLAIFANTRVLHVASVETVIVFRTTVALLTSVGDYIWLGKELPTPRSWASLFIIVGGAAGYMISEGGSITNDSITWGVIYISVLAFEMIYVKHVVTEVKMSTWTRVYYNNSISLGMNLPLIILAQMSLEDSALSAMVPPPVVEGPEPLLAIGGTVMMSAVGGLGISYAGFGFRSIVSATSFTLTGIVCKVLTVMMSQVLFKNTASAQGLLCLAMCVAGATLYRPAADRARSGNATDEMQPLRSSSEGDDRALLARSRSSLARQQ